MANQFTIERYGEEWAARDATGAKYGQSADLFQAIEAAERLARRIGARVVLSREAQNFLLSKKPRKPVT